MIVNLLNALLKEKVSSELDKMSWNRRKRDSFSVKKAYRTPQPEVLRPSSSRVFAFQVFQPKQPCFLGKQLRVKSLPLTTYKEGGGNCPIDATCVKM